MNIKEFKIFCIHLIGTSTSNERYNILTTSLKNMGIFENSKIYEYVRSTHDDRMIELYPSLKDEYYDNIYITNKKVYGNVYNELKNYYHILKLSYIKNYDYIMIFEDDIVYDKDINYFSHMISCMPNTFDICKFTRSYNFKLNYNDNYDNNWFTLFDDKLHDPAFLFWCPGWCISRRAIKLLIDEIDNSPYVIDGLFYRLYKKYNMKIYIPNYLFTEWPNIKSLII